MARIAIIGSGFIGRAWAIAHARAGNEVRLWDRDSGAAGAARDFVAGVLPDLEANGLLNGHSIEQVLDWIRPVSNLESAVEDVAYVQENTFEDLEIKKEVFSMLDAVVPAAAVIASSTSALMPSRFTEHVAGRQRCLVAHPINPPYLVPAVEVVPAPWDISRCCSADGRFAPRHRKFAHCDEA